MINADLSLELSLWYHAGMQTRSDPRSHTRTSWTTRETILVSSTTSSLTRTKKVSSLPRASSPDTRLTLSHLLAGNFTRFFNHSCSGSNVTPIKIIRRDLPGFEHEEVPVIGFVTTKRVEAGEEFLLNYRGGDAVYVPFPTSNYFGRAVPN